MKHLVVLLLIAITTSSAFADRVRAYTKKDGTYVAPHERSAPNSTKFDNYQTKGNINPNTGKPGKKSAWPK